jgi:hypothetical protein
MNFKEREKYNIFHIYKVKGIYSSLIYQFLEKI